MKTQLQLELKIGDENRLLSFQLLQPCLTRQLQQHLIQNLNQSKAGQYQLINVLVRPCLKNLENRQEPLIQS